MSTTYVPALRFGFLTSAYDLVIGRLTREDEIRRATIELLSPRSGDRILDVGAGTGTLALRLKRQFPDTRVVGVDGDPEILELARTKAAGADVEFRHAFAQEIPFDAGSFDRVTSTLVFHHLSSDIKRAALREIFRVLRPGGRLVLADWGRPDGALDRLQFLSVRLLDGFETTADNAAGRLPRMLREAGFEGVTEVRRMRLGLGTLSFFAAARPAPAGGR